MTFIDWNGYTVHKDGSINNKDSSIKSFKENSKGYLFTNFYYNKKSNCHLVHTVVWMAFMGHVPIGYEVDHVNNNRKDNRLSNLQLLSKSENNKKAYDSGNRSFIFGDTNPNSLKRKKQNG
jgi:hypothetical protein